MHYMPLKKAVGKITPTALLVIVLVSLSTPAGYAGEQEPVQLLSCAMKRYETVQTYTCLLDKRVAKNGILHEDLSIRVKFHKPANYYFRWEEGKRKGREVIFAAGRNNGKIVAHPGGWFRFMTLRLNPEGRLAMKENRHSLRNSGLGKIMQLVEADAHRAQRNGLKAIHFSGEERIDNRATWVIQGRFPENQGYYAHRVVLFIDQALGLPIKVSIYDGSDALLEEYLFRQLEINIPFKACDFDPANPAYNFFRKDGK